MMNLVLTMRDRTVLFFNYLFPLIFFFAFAELFRAGRGSGISFFVGTVLTMGILGNGLWGAGMRSVQERETNILRRYKVTPISPLPLLIASMVSGWLLYLPVVVLVLGLAHFLYGMPMPEKWISLLVMVSLGVCAFRAIGLILAAVTNTMQEATVAIQLLYMPMLFLSGATIPAALLPAWAQTIAEFMPASYLVSGFQGIFFRNQTIWDNLPSVGALLVAMVLGTFLAVQLFRWEKGEKIPARNKLWVLAVLGPFLLMGSYRAWTREHIGDNQAMYRELQRSGSFLIRGARVITGTGTVLETGSVLVRDGKIAEIYGGTGPDPKEIGADPIEGAGKTLLPGLIDAHVHLSPPGGMSTANDDYDTRKSMPRAAAALLYSGVTGARSAGDGLNDSLWLRGRIESGRTLGAYLKVCGPMFTVEGGHGTEFLAHVPQALQESIKAELVRMPKSADEARQQVRDLKAAGVDAIKLVLETGWGEGMLFDRMDREIARAAAAEAHSAGLPVSVHTGDPRDVADAVEFGARSIEHGSGRGEIADELFARMRKGGISLVPALGAWEANAAYFAGQPGALDQSLVEQTVPARVIQGTRAFLESRKGTDASKAALFSRAFEKGRDNLVRAWRAGVTLVAGSDAGSPLVFHGPSLHHELQLWVRAGIPASVAIQAATGNAAKLLGIAGRTGTIQRGLDADLLLVDGNPLIDIAATERISMVVLKGERIRRSTLFEQK
jgi:imidazolonepropionase-like amidohydrolase/ABC-type multidrug transport system permease subunit